MQKLFSLSGVEVTDPIVLDSDKLLTFSVSGGGTVQAEIKLTDHVDAVWKVIQVCADGVVYPTNSGARLFRFNQTAASGATICEVTSG